MENSAHILVVDDDPEIRVLLANYLRRNGYAATTVADGVEMRRAMARSTFSLLVLDIMLPGDDGLTLCRSIRERSSVPIIMLTARGAPTDRIIGIEMGADDYLPKPFDPRELLVRIKAVLRRYSPLSRSINFRDTREYQFAGWTLVTTGRNLVRPDGALVPLSESQFRLLATLLSHSTRVWSRVELADIVGGRRSDPFDRSIDVRVSRLRQLLGDSDSQRLIKTAHGEGYTMGVEVVAQ